MRKQGKWKGQKCVWEIKKHVLRSSFIVVIIGLFFVVRSVLPLYRSCVNCPDEAKDYGLEYASFTGDSTKKSDLGLLRQESQDSETLVPLIENILPGYIASNGLDITKQYQLSNSFIVSGSGVSDNQLSFVFCEGQCIGELVVSTETGASSFFRERCAEITDVYRDETPVAVVCFGAVSIYVISSDYQNVIRLYGSENEIDISSLVVDYYPITLQNVIEMNCSNSETVSEKIQQSRESAYLSVPIVPNSSTNSAPNGLCWVASSLSVMQFYLGNLPYSVDDFYYLYLAYYPGSTYGSPTGGFDNVKRYYIIYNLSYGGGWTGLSFSSVKAKINSGKPVIAGITTAPSSAGVVGHVVVVCGYNKTTQTGATYYYYYQLMDPNCSNYVTITAPSSGTGITYNAGSHIYVNWSYSVY
ncbi:MAG: C39 family peptidase [Lachnospiraceae bacterium]|nr:C39 family peptidase [Lachnospiraceae bacterium]